MKAKMSTPDNQCLESVLTLNYNGNPSPCCDEAANDEADAAAQPRQEGCTKQREKYYRYDEERDEPSQARNALLLVAVLVATATYKTGLSPPGGVWLDTNLNANPKQVAGVSIMGTNNFVTFACFMFGNTLGFHSSLYMMEFLTRGFPLRLELNFAIFGMALAYCISMAAVSPTRPLVYAFNAFSFVAQFSLPFIVPFLRDSRLSCKIRSTVNRFFANRQP
ncbi:hypothetical protein QN277_018804 [Acacia crassicarpa]|uniref:PGG domain-containing protein n=1 Tax=Acacia crassicarpa TaxID=499986 RepID=A0AAE1JWQ4_9FABA|nr:hypothetical protein QN277_018804 [Acacia crassicarpa]